MSPRSLSISISIQDIRQVKILTHCQCMAKLILICSVCLLCISCGKKEPDYDAFRQPYNREQIRKDVADRLREHQTRKWKKIDTTGATDLFGNSVNVDLYVDSQSVRSHRMGNSAWSRWEYKEPQSSSATKAKYVSRAVLTVVNCQKEETGELEEDLYSSNDLSGEVIASLTTDLINRDVVHKEVLLKMRSYIAGGLSGRLASEICSKRQ